MQTKDLTEQERNELLRKQLWIDVYVAYVSAAKSIYKDGAYVWADIALRRFDETFPTKSHQ